MSYYQPTERVLSQTADDGIYQNKELFLLGAVFLHFWPVAGVDRVISQGALPF